MLHVFNKVLQVLHSHVTSCVAICYCKHMQILFQNIQDNIKSVIIQTKAVHSTNPEARCGYLLSRAGNFTSLQAQLAGKNRECCYCQSIAWLVSLHQGWYLLLCTGPIDQLTENLDTPLIQTLIRIVNEILELLSKFHVISLDFFRQLQRWINWH